MNHISESIVNTPSDDKNSAEIEPKPKKRRDAYRTIKTEIGEFGRFTIPAGGRWPLWAAANFVMSEFTDHATGPDPERWAGSEDRDEFRILRELAKQRPTLAFWRGDAFAYSPSANHYEAVPTESLRAHILAFLSHGQMRTADGKSIAIPLTARSVNDVIGALKSLPNLLLDDTFDPPHWRRWTGHETPEWYPDPSSLVTFRDGWVSIDKATGDHKFISRYNDRKVTRPMAASLFATSGLPFKFADASGEPVEWLRFLASIWGDADSPEARTLQEFMGLTLTLDTSHHKILLLTGPRRSGKGSILRVWRSLLGSSNVASPSAATLSERFGLWSLLDRRLAVISDARFRHGPDSSVVAERLLSISGEDGLTIDRKNLPPLTNVKLSARLVVATNEIPRLSDSARALPSRFLALPMTKSFYGREDRQLGARLEREVPSLLLWALEGLKRLHQRGHFEQPESGKAIIDSLNRHSSDVALFTDEQCELESAQQTQLRLAGQPESRWDEDPQVLFDAYRDWAERSEGRRPRSKSDFTQALIAIEGVHRQHVRLKDGSRPWRITGLRLLPNTRRNEWAGGAR
ncbi:MAG: DUF5906 domain-containing protein [bacterium]|nr:DUF5906 domain-containing protein [bacterium]